MTPLQLLSTIEELVINRASVGEIRGHILPLRDALEKCESLTSAHSELQKSHAKIEKEKSDINLRYLELKSKEKDDGGDPPWPSPGLKHI